MKLEIPRTVQIFVIRDKQVTVQLAKKEEYEEPTGEQNINR